MLKEAKTFAHLQSQKEREHQNFVAAIEKIKMDHKNEVMLEEDLHRREMEYK